MTPNPIAWLRSHGFADRMPADDKSAWEWLREHAKDSDVMAALKQIPSGVRLPISENEKLRYLLWIRHGHDGLYGDDAEMQCARCGLDFRRDPVERLTQVLVRDALMPTTAHEPGI